MRVSTSPDHYMGAHSPRLKAARRLTKRAFRQRERAFLAEGPQAVAEAHRFGARISDLFVTVPARSKHADLVAEIGGEVGFSDPREFRRAFKRWTGMAPQEARRAAA